MSELFTTFIKTPLYNGLILLLDIGPWVDLGIAVIALTVVVKLALFPVSLKAVRTQRMLKELEGPMKEIREKYKDNREEQGRKMLELYREKGVNPFSSFVTLLIQLPIIIGLYFVFFQNHFPEINQELLYSFVPVPDHIPMLFLGFVNMTGKSVVLALLAGITQAIQAHHSFPAAQPRSDNPTFGEDFARSMQTQMKYIFPLLMIFIAYITNSAVALYLITSNIFAIGQELYVKRTQDRERAIDA